MTVWALVHQATGGVEVRYERDDAPASTLPAPTRPGYRWMRDVAPAFNSSTHRLAVVTPGIDSVAEDLTYEVAAIPAAELAAQANAVVIQKLAASDVGMIRTVDDLISALVASGKFSLDELPPRARDKLAQRAALRATLVP